MIGSSFVVRAATEDEPAACTDLWVAAVAARDGQAESEAVRRRAGDKFSVDRVALVVAEDQEGLVGFVLVTAPGTGGPTDPGDAAYLSLLAVDETFDAGVVARKVIESDVILVASPRYLQRRGAPQSPEELSQHDFLRVKTTFGRSRALRLWCPRAPDAAIDLDLQPLIIANHVDTLLRAALDGAGIIPVSVDLAAPQLARGELVRVLSPWIMGRLAIYAALPSRKFIPRRTKALLDYLMEQAREKTAMALSHTDGHTSKRPAPSSRSRAKGGRSQGGA